MLRPTPQRLLYLLVGLIIGGAAVLAYSSVGGASLTAPFFGTAPVQPKVAAAFTGATLTKVLPANQNATKGAASLRVNALEIYVDGFSLTYSILSGQPGEPAPVLQPDRFDATDDKGIIYHVSAIGSTSTVAPGLSSGYLTFTPALSPDAKTLTVTVPHLFVVAGISDANAARVLDGPWQVQVALR